MSQRQCFAVQDNETVWWYFWPLFWTWDELIAASIFRCQETRLLVVIQGKLMRVLNWLIEDWGTYIITDLHNTSSAQANLHSHWIWEQFTESGTSLYQSLFHLRISVMFHNFWASWILWKETKDIATELMAAWFLTSMQLNTDSFFAVCYGGHRHGCHPLCAISGCSLQKHVNRTENTWMTHASSCHRIINFSVYKKAPAMPCQLFWYREAWSHGWPWKADSINT